MSNHDTPLAPRQHLDGLLNCIQDRLMLKNFAALRYQSPDKRLRYLSKITSSCKVVMRRQLHPAWISPDFSDDCNRFVYEITSKVKQDQDLHPDYPMAWFVRTNYDNGDEAIDILISRPLSE